MVSVGNLNPRGQPVKSALLTLTADVFLRASRAEVIRRHGAAKDFSGFRDANAVADAFFHSNFA